MTLEKEKNIMEIRANTIDKDLILPSLEGGKIGLNLGCGGMYLDGWINCDKKNPDGMEKIKCDEIMDLNHIPYHFDSDYADYILLHHVIEHIPCAFECVNECYRILKEGGKLIIHYPHYSSPRAKRVNHVWQLGRNSFHRGNTPFRKREIRLLYSQFHKTRLINWWINKLGNYYEKIPVLGCTLFPAYEVQYVLFK